MTLTMVSFYEVLVMRLLVFLSGLLNYAFLTHHPSVNSKPDVTRKHLSTAAEFLIYHSFIFSFPFPHFRSESVAFLFLFNLLLLTHPHILGS